MTLDEPHTPAPKDDGSAGGRETQETGPAAAEPPEPRPLLPRGRFEPGTVLGDWRVEGVIGVGGMGTVYSAVHALIGKRAAIKVVRAELCSNPLTRERFVTEARVANQIGHPNIIDIFHIDALDDGRPYLVMELLKGQTLGRRMSDGRVLPHEAVEILLQICDALGAAHARGIVHRDLKPDNVFLVENGDTLLVKLVDWGIAKLMDAVPVGSTATSTGTLVGTPQYMSPEQARARAVDGRTDVYSLGAIAYELFLEGPPFTADNIADLVTMHLREPVPPPSELWPDIPPELERILVAMLAKAPDDRPSLDEIQQTLRKVASSLESRGRWHRSGRISVPAMVVEFDRAPTWGPDPISLDDESSGSRMRLASHLDEGDVLTRSSAGSGRGRVRRPMTRVVGVLATFLMVAGAGTVVAELARDPRDMTPTAEAARDVVAHPVANEAAVPQVAAPAPLDLPELAAPMEPGATLDAMPAAAMLGEPPAILDLRVKPQPAWVVVDGDRAKPVNGRVVRNLSSGVLEVQVTAPGYVPYHRRIEINPGTVLLEVNLKPVGRGHARIVHQPERRRGLVDIDPDGTIDPFQ